MMTTPSAPRPLLSAAFVLALLSVAAFPQSAPATTSAAASPAQVRATAQWNLGDGRLALSGYDPVAYFPEGGGKALKGSPSLTLEHAGAVYRFATEQNRERFRAAPEHYEAAYGGWCAWAMAQDQGEKVEVDPRSFLVRDGRLLVFYDGFFADTRESWQEGDGAQLASRADTNWTRLSGEAPAATPAAVPAAKLAPAFSLTDPAGKAHVLADLRGRVVVLDFWATWCPPCREAMPAVQRLHERYADAPVSIYGVNVAERSKDADPAGFMRERGFTYTLLHGTEAVAQAYGVTALPTFVVIGPDGGELWRHVGYAADFETRVAALIDGALPRPAATPETPETPETPQTPQR